MYRTRVSRHSLLIMRLLMALAIGLAGCSRPDTPATTPPAASPAPPFKISASIQDIMNFEIEPSADGLWDAVSTTVTAAGVDEKRPQTEAEWLQMRRHAITLVEAANLLMMDGRKVLAPGQTMADEGVEGVLSSKQVQAGIDANRQQFVQFATLLHDTGEQMLRAVDAKHVQGMLDAGEALDAACESCHLVFWYPNQVIPAPED
ncbi:MAG: hypothetical protein SXG53_19535 [Pseudomonadota bacterium]|nr:hypothetical protein [Pseudomonadota bacterium]